MKAITIHQPWASLIAIGAKQYETRSWSTKYRGPIAIHASKKDTTDIMEALPYCVIQTMYGAFAKAGRIDDGVFPFRGCIVAIAELVDVHKTEELNPSEQERMFGEWAPGRYAWELKNIKLLPIPVSISGKQGLWNWNEEDESGC